MRTLNTSVVIHVTDLERALDYYKDVLGFVEDFRLPAYAGLILDHAVIYLSAPESTGIKKVPGSAHCCIDCDEVDTYYATIVQNDADISVPLADRFYGSRDFAISDPDGNTLIFGADISK